MIGLALRAAPWLFRALFSRTALAVQGTVAADHFLLDGKGAETAGIAVGKAAAVAAPILSAETGKFFRGLGIPTPGDLTRKAKQFFGFDPVTADIEREEKRKQEQKDEERMLYRERALALTQSFNDNANNHTWDKLMIVLGALYDMTRGRFSEGCSTILSLVKAELGLGPDVIPGTNAAAPGRAPRPAPP